MSLAPEDQRSSTSGIVLAVIAIVVFLGLVGAAGFRYLVDSVEWEYDVIGIEAEYESAHPAATPD